MCRWVKWCCVLESFFSDILMIICVMGTENRDMRHSFSIAIIFNFESEFTLSPYSFLFLKRIRPGVKVKSDKALSGAHTSSNWLKMPLVSIYFILSIPNLCRHVGNRDIYLWKWKQPCLALLADVTSTISIISNSHSATPRIASTTNNETSWHVLVQISYLF